MSARKKPHYCAVRHCKNNTMNCDHSFFRFPRTASRFQMWAVATGRDDLLNKPYIKYDAYRICAIHFEDKMFANPLKNRLHFDAIPTKQLTEDVAVTDNGTHGVEDPRPCTSSATEDALEIPVEHTATTAEDPLAIPSTSGVIATVKNLFPVPSTSDTQRREAMSQTEATLSARTPRKQKLRRQLL